MNSSPENALVLHRWAALSDAWLPGFHDFVVQELRAGSNWTCGDDEARWVMGWVYRLILEPGLGQLRARADEHARRGPVYSATRDRETQRYTVEWLKDFILDCLVTEIIRSRVDESYDSDASMTELPSQNSVSATDSEAGTGDDEEEEAKKGMLDDPEAVRERAILEEACASLPSSAAAVTQEQLVEVCVYVHNVCERELCAGLIVLMLNYR